jgi:hypothetical protein
MEYTIKVMDTKEFIIDTHENAADILNRMKEIANDYGFASLMDLKDLIGLVSVYGDRYYRWTEPMLRHGAVCRVRDGWVVDLPAPIFETPEPDYKPRANISCKRYPKTDSTPKPESKPIYIVVNTEEVDDVDNTLATVFKYVYTISDREVHITVT